MKSQFNRSNEPVQYGIEFGFKLIWLCLFDIVSKCHWISMWVVENVICKSELHWVTIFIPHTSKTISLHQFVILWGVGFIDVDSGPGLPQKWTLFRPFQNILVGTSLFRWTPLWPKWYRKAYLSFIWCSFTLKVIIIRNEKSKKFQLSYSEILSKLFTSSICPQAWLIFYMRALLWT